MIYSPREDSFLLEKAVKKYALNKKVLDMCTGSGIQSQAALNSKAKSVLAIDINSESIEHVKSLGIESIQSDIFKRVKGKFDLIVCNPPYLPEDKREDKESALATTGGKRGDEFICKFLKQSKSFLNKNGVILLLVSSLTPKERIEKILLKNKMQKSIISQEKMEFEKLEVWLISES